MCLLCQKWNKALLGHQGVTSGREKLQLRTHKKMVKEHLAHLKARWITTRMLKELVEVIEELTVNFWGFLKNLCGPTTWKECRYFYLRKRKEKLQTYQLIYQQVKKWHGNFSALHHIQQCTLCTYFCLFVFLFSFLLPLLHSALFFSWSSWPALPFSPHSISFLFSCSLFMEQRRAEVVPL